MISTDSLHATSNEFQLSQGTPCLLVHPFPWYCWCSIQRHPLSFLSKVPRFEPGQDQHLSYIEVQRMIIRKAEHTFGSTGLDTLLPSFCNISYRHISYLWRASMLSYLFISFCLFANIFSKFDVSINISACSIRPGNNPSNTSYRFVSER